MNKQLSSILLNSVCLIPLFMVLGTVFIVDNSLVNGVVTAKYFWFYLSLPLCIVVTVFSILIYKKKVRLNYTDLFILLFGVLNIIISVNIHKKIDTKFILFGFCILLYFLFRILLSQNKNYRHFMLLFFIITAGIESVWGIGQLYGLIPSYHSIFNVTGSFFNPGPFAGYLAIVAPLCLFFILKGKRTSYLTSQPRIYFIHIRWVICCVVFVLIVITLPSTLSRASWIATLSGCILALLFFIKRTNKIRLVWIYIRHRKHLFVLGGCVALIILLITLFSTYKLKKDSADGRFFIWKISMHLLVEKPLGVGLGNFGVKYGECQATYFEKERGSDQEKYLAENPDYAFNEYIQIAVESGIIGIVLFVAIVVFAIYYGLKNKSYGPVSSLITLLIFAAMSYPFNVLPFLIISVFLLSICSTPPISKKEIEGYSKISTATVLVALLICVIFTIRDYASIPAYKNWNDAKNLYKAKVYTKACDKYEELYPYLKDEIDFLFEYAQSNSQIGKYKESNNILHEAAQISADPMIYNIMGKNYQEMKEYNLAEQNYKKAINIIPNRLYPYYLLAKLYHNTGERSKEKELASLIVDMKPKIDSPATHKMKDEMKNVLKMSIK